MKLFRRSLAAFLAVIYGVFNVALSHAAESRFWEERRRATQQATRPSSADLLAQLPLAAPWRADIPAEPVTALPPLVRTAAAPVRRAVAAAAPFAALRSFQPPARAGNPVVFLIQDLHGAAEAQENIAALLERWTADGPVWAGVEGAAGAFDFSADRVLAGPAAGRWLAAYFIRENVLTGAEAAALAAPTAPTLWGVEDAALYQAHARALREGLKARPAAEPFLAEIGAALSARKRAHASPAFLAFDRASADYHGGGSLGAYARFLTKAGAGGAQLRRFTAALEAEETLDFKAVEAERARLLTRLADRLAPADLQRLAAASLRLRAGEMTSSAYYDFLLAFCRAQGVAASDLPAFRAYTDYVRRAEAIDRTLLLEELSRAERAAADRTAVTPAEKELLALSRDAALLGKLVRHEMTPADWAAHKERRAEMLRLPERLPEMAGARAEMGALLAPFEDFCRLALERDQALAANAWSQLPVTGVAALVAGGFHTEGLARLLSSKGAGVAVLTPRISRLPDTHYADLFDRQPLPLEKVFAGDKLFLVRELVSSPSASPAAAPGAWAYRRTLIAAGAALRAALEKWSAVPAEVLAAVRRMPRVRVFMARTVDGGVWMSLGLDEEEEVTLITGASLDDMPTAVNDPDESLKIPTNGGVARVDVRRESAGLLEKLRSLTKNFKPAPRAPTPRQAMEAAWGPAMAAAAAVVRKLQTDPSLTSFSKEEKGQHALVLEAVQDMGVASPRAVIWLHILRNDIPRGTGRRALKELEDYLLSDQPHFLPAGSALKEILQDMGDRSRRVFEQSFGISDQVLGNGAMSQALDVRSLAAKPAFALIAKRLPPEFNEEQERLLLWDCLVRWELQDAAPGLPRVFMQWGSGADRTVIIEKAYGGDLERFAQQKGAPSFAQAYVLIERLLADLAAVHAAGYLHNDIKPENILLMEAGGMSSARLTDFNIAHSKAIDWAALYKTGRGTLDFAAPESFQIGVQNERTDLFQVGATLYYLLTGLLTHGNPRQKALAPVPAAHDLGLLLPDMPKEVARFIMSLAAVNPKNRPASAAEALAQWRAIAEDLPSPTLPILSRVMNAAGVTALALLTMGASLLLPGNGGPLLAMTAAPQAGGLGALVAAAALASGALMVIWGRDKVAKNRGIAEAAVEKALSLKLPVPVTLDMDENGDFVEASKRSLVHKGLQVAVRRHMVKVADTPQFFYSYAHEGGTNGLQKGSLQMLNEPYLEAVGADTRRGVRPPPSAEPQPLSSFKPLSLDLAEGFDEPPQPSAAKPSVPDPSDVTQTQSVPLAQLEAMRREVEEEQSWEAAPAPSEPAPPTVRKPRGALSRHWESIPGILLLSADEEQTLDHNTMAYDLLPEDFKAFILDHLGNIRPVSMSLSIQGDPFLQIHHDEDVGFFMDGFDLEPEQQRAMDLLLMALNSGVRNSARAPASILPVPRTEIRTLPLVGAEEDDDRTPIKDLSPEEWERLFAPISSGTRKITGLLIFLLPPGWYLLHHGMDGGLPGLMMMAAPRSAPGFETLFVALYVLVGITFFRRSARKDFEAVVESLAMLDTFRDFPAYPQVNQDGVLLALDVPKSAIHALVRVDKGPDGVVEIRPLTRVSTLQKRRLELLLTAKNKAPGRLLPRAALPPSPPRIIPAAGAGPSMKLGRQADAKISGDEITLQVDLSETAKRWARPAASLPEVTPVYSAPEITPVYPSGLLNDLTASTPPDGNSGGNASLGTLTDIQSDRVIRLYADRLTADAALERKIMDVLGKAPWERWLTSAARENPLIKNLPPPRNIKGLLERVEIRLVPTALGFLADENGLAVAHYGTGGKAFGGNRRVVYLAAGPDGNPLFSEADLAAIAAHEVAHLFFLDQGLEHDTANVHSFATDVHKMASWAFLGKPDALDQAIAAAQRRVFSENNLADVAKRASIVAAFPDMLQNRSRPDWPARRTALEAARDAAVASPRALAVLERLGGSFAADKAEKRQKVLADALDGMATKAASLVPDELEGRYTIIRWMKDPVAEMTSIAIASDNVTGQQVVVKFLTDKGFQEYAIHRELQDIVPGLLHVWRGGHWAGSGDAIVLEHARGRTLPFAQKPMAARDVLRLARPLLHTLSAMHKAGWLHNDIKPENIFFRQAGDWDHPLLGDLGNASRATKKHLIRHGSLPYMAPETLATPEKAGGLANTPHTAPEVLSKPEKAKGFTYTPQTDLYQLGVVLYRMMSGTYPFDRESMTDRVENDPIDIRKHDPSLPDDAADLIMSMLRRDPAQRAPSADAVLAALDNVDLDALSDRAPPSSSAATLDFTYVVGLKLLRFLGHSAPTRRDVELKVAPWLELPFSLLPVVFVLMHPNKSLGQFAKRQAGQLAMLLATISPFLLLDGSLVLSAFLGLIGNAGVHFGYNLFVPSAPLSLGDGQDGPPITRIQSHEVTDWSLFSAIWAKPTYIPDSFKVRFNAFFTALKNRVPPEDQERLWDVFVPLIVRMQARNPAKGEQRLEQIFHHAVALPSLKDYQQRQGRIPTPEQGRKRLVENVERNLLRDILADDPGLLRAEDRDAFLFVRERARVLEVPEGKFAPLMTLLEGPVWLWAEGLALDRGSLTQEMFFQEFAAPLARIADGPETFRAWAQALLPVLKGRKTEEPSSPDAAKEPVVRKQRGSAAVPKVKLTEAQKKASRDEKQAALQRMRSTLLENLRNAVDQKDPRAFGLWVDAVTSPDTAGGRWPVFRPVYLAIQRTVTALWGDVWGGFAGRVMAPVLLESALIGMISQALNWAVPHTEGMAAYAFVGNLVWLLAHGRKRMFSKEVLIVFFVTGLSLGGAVFGLAEEAPRLLVYACLLVPHLGVNADAETWGKVPVPTMPTPTAPSKRHLRVLLADGRAAVRDRYKGRIEYELGPWDDTVSFVEAADSREAATLIRAADGGEDLPFDLAIVDRRRGSFGRGAAAALSARFPAIPVMDSVMLKGNESTNRHFGADLQRHMPRWVPVSRVFWAGEHLFQATLRADGAFLLQDGSGRELALVPPVYFTPPHKLSLSLSDRASSMIHNPVHGYMWNVHMRGVGSRPIILDLRAGQDYRLVSRNDEPLMLSRLPEAMARGLGGTVRGKDESERAAERERRDNVFQAAVSLFQRQAGRWPRLTELIEMVRHPRGVLAGASDLSRPSESPAAPPAAVKASATLSISGGGWWTALLFAPLAEEFLFRVLPFGDGWFVVANALFVPLHVFVNIHRARQAGYRGWVLWADVGLRFIVQVAGTAVLASLYMNQQNYLLNVAAHALMNLGLLSLGGLVQPLSGVALSVTPPDKNRKAFDLALPSFDEARAAQSDELTDKEMEMFLGLFIEYGGSQDKLFTALRWLGESLKGELKEDVAARAEALVMRFRWNGHKMSVAPSVQEVVDHNLWVLSPLWMEDGEFLPGSQNGFYWQTIVFADHFGRLVGMRPPAQGNPSEQPHVDLYVRVLPHLRSNTAMRWSIVGEFPPDTREALSQTFMQAAAALERKAALPPPHVKPAPLEVFSAWRELELLSRGTTEEAQERLASLVKGYSYGRLEAVSLVRTLHYISAMGGQNIRGLFGRLQIQESQLRQENLRKVRAWLPRDLAMGAGFTLKFDAVGRAVSLALGNEQVLVRDDTDRFRAVSYVGSPLGWEGKPKDAQEVLNLFQRRMVRFLEQDLMPFAPRSDPPSAPRRPVLAPLGPKPSEIYPGHLPFMLKAQREVVDGNAQMLMMMYGDQIATNVYGEGRMRPFQADSILVAGGVDADGQIQRLAGVSTAEPGVRLDSFRMLLTEGGLSVLSPSDKTSILAFSLKETLRRVRMKALNDADDVLAGFRAQDEAPTPETHWLAWVRPMLRDTLHDYDDIMPRAGDARRSRSVYVMEKFDRMLKRLDSDIKRAPASLSVFRRKLDDFVEQAQKAASDKSWPPASLNELKRLNSLITPVLDSLEESFGPPTSSVSAFGEAMVSDMLQPLLRTLTQDQLGVLLGLSANADNGAARAARWYDDLVRGNAMAAEMAAGKLASLLSPARGGYRRFQALMAMKDIRRERPTGEAADVLAHLQGIFRARGAAPSVWVMSGDVFDTLNLRHAVIAFMAGLHRKGARPFTVLVGAHEMAQFMGQKDPMGTLARLLAHEWARTVLKMSHEDVVDAGLGVVEENTWRPIGLQRWEGGESLEDYVTRLMDAARRWQNLGAAEARLQAVQAKAIPPSRAATAAGRWLERHGEVLDGFYSGQSMAETFQDRKALLMSLRPDMDQDQVQKLLVFFQELADFGLSRQLTPAFRRELREMVDGLEEVLNLGLDGALQWSGPLVGSHITDVPERNDLGRPADPGNWVVAVVRPGFRFNDGREIPPRLLLGDEPMAALVARRNVLLSALDRDADPGVIADYRRSYAQAQKEMFHHRGARILERLERVTMLLSAQDLIHSRIVRDGLSSENYSLARALRALDALSNWARAYHEGSPVVAFIEKISFPLKDLVSELSYGSVYDIPSLENHSSRDIPREVLQPDSSSEAGFVVRRALSSGFLAARPELGDDSVRAQVKTFQGLDDLLLEQAQGLHMYVSADGLTPARRVPVVIDENDNVVAVGSKILLPDVTLQDIHVGLAMGHFKELFASFSLDRDGLVAKRPFSPGSMDWVRRLFLPWQSSEEYVRGSAWWLENVVSLVAGLMVGAAARLMGAAPLTMWAAAQFGTWAFFVAGHVPAALWGPAEERRISRGRLASAIELALMPGLFSLVGLANPPVPSAEIVTQAVVAFFLCLNAYSFYDHWKKNNPMRPILGRLEKAADRLTQARAAGAPLSRIKALEAEILDVRLAALDIWERTRGPDMARGMLESELSRSAGLPADFGTKAVESLVKRLSLRQVYGPQEFEALGHRGDALEPGPEADAFGVALDDLGEITKHEDLLPGRGAAIRLVEAEDEDVLPPMPSLRMMDSLFPRPGTNEPLRVAVQPVVEKMPESFELRSVIQALGYLPSQVEWAPAASLSAPPHITVSRTAEFISIKVEGASSLFMTRSDRFRAGGDYGPKVIQRYLRPFIPDAAGRMVSGHGEQVLLDWVVKLLRVSLGGWDPERRVFMAGATVLSRLHSSEVDSLTAFLGDFRLEKIVKGPLAVPDGIFSLIIKAAGGRLLPRTEEPALNSPGADEVYAAFHRRGVRVAITVMSGVPEAPSGQPMIAAFRVPMTQPGVKAMKVFLGSTHGRDRFRSPFTALEDLALKLAHEYGRVHLGLSHEELLALGIPAFVSQAARRMRSGMDVDAYVGELMNLMEEVAAAQTSPLPRSFNESSLDVDTSDLPAAEFRGHGSRTAFNLTVKGGLTPMKMSMHAGLALSLLPRMDVDESDYWRAGAAVGEDVELATLYLPLLRKDPRALAEAQRVFWETWRRASQEPALYESTLLPLAALLHHAGVSFTDLFDESWKGLSSDMRLLALGAPGLPADPAAAAVRLDEAWNTHYDGMRRRLSRLDSRVRLAAVPSGAGTARIYDVSYLLEGGNGLRRDGLVKALQGESAENAPLVVADRENLNEKTLLPELSTLGISLDKSVFMQASEEVSADGYVLADGVEKFLNKNSIRPSRLDFITPLPGNIRTDGMDPARFRIWELLDDELIRDMSAGLEKALEKVRFTKISA